VEKEREVEIENNVGKLDKYISNIFQVKINDKEKNYNSYT